MSHHFVESLTLLESLRVDSDPQVFIRTPALVSLLSECVGRPVADGTVKSWSVNFGIATNRNGGIATWTFLVSRFALDKLYELAAERRASRKSNPKIGETANGK